MLGGSPQCVPGSLAILQLRSHPGFMGLFLFCFVFSVKGVCVCHLESQVIGRSKKQDVLGAAYVATIPCAALGYLLRNQPQPKLALARPS